MTINAPVLRYAEVPHLLAEHVVGFADSPEYRQERDYAPFPGIVFAALARYLSRMHRETDRRPELASGMSVIEQLVQRGDSDATNAIVTEFFHTVANESGGLLKELGPSSRRLYDQWEGLA
jgi:hypothetical protein